MTSFHEIQGHKDSRSEIKKATRWFDDLDRTHGARFPLSGYGLSATPFAP